MPPLEVRHQIVTAIAQAEAKLEWSTALHPLNADAQKQAFLAGEIEEPEFEYAPVKITPPTFPNITVETELDALYRDRMGMTQAMVMLLELVGQDEEFTALSQTLYPVIDLNQHQFQGAGLTLNLKPETNKITSAQSAERFRHALAAVQLTDWQVLTKPNISSRMMVNQFTKQIVIRSDAEFTEKQLKGLTCHEIGCHVMRAVNGAKQAEPLLKVGTLQGRLIEEGVACNLENSNPSPRLYQRHQAVQLALKHSFRDTWQQLCDLEIDPQTAWVHTLRVKRGLKHGSSAGAFTKDCLYAQGFVAIKKYLDDGGELAPLLSAPIHPDEIKLFADYQVFERVEF